MDAPRRKANSNHVIVNNKSNFKSHLVRCQAIMDDIQFDQLVLSGIGKAIPRTTNLALQLNSNNYNTFQLTPSTYSIKIIEDKCTKPVKAANKDRFDPDELNLDKTKRHSYVPAIEIVVRKSKLEIDKIRYARKHAVYESARKPTPSV